MQVQLSGLGSSHNVGGCCAWSLRIRRSLLQVRDHHHIARPWRIVVKHLQGNENKMFCLPPLKTITAPWHNRPIPKGNLVFHTSSPKLWTRGKLLVSGSACVLWTIHSTKLNFPIRPCWKHYTPIRMWRDLRTQLHLCSCCSTWITSSQLKRNGTSIPHQTDQIYSLRNRCEMLR